MEKQFVPFTGNCPSNVSKDAKYSVRFDKREYVVGIYYESTDGELWYPTSDNHPDLVEMVNDVKMHFSGARGGIFYINEYKQVLVPTKGEEKAYYFAGEYKHPLEFEFEGNILSGDAKDLEGNRITPGDIWSGPHPGIPYVLKAGGKDIYYRYKVRPNVEKKVTLSEHLSSKTAEMIAWQIVEIKGAAGGRFYINEFCQMFAPVNKSSQLEYLYIGRIEDLKNWFPKPTIAI